MSTNLFKNILVPYDGSKSAAKAFNTAVDVAKKFDSETTVLTCIAKPTYRGTWYHDLSSAASRIKKEDKAAAEKILKMVKPAKNKFGLSIKYKVIPVMSITSEVSSFAKSHKVDLVVMGAHGKTGLEKILLGSI